MKNLKDDRTTILPSTTRGGKGLPSSLALDSPSVMSKFATPKPTSAVDSDRLHVIYDATSSLHDTYDETTSMLDTTVPLGEFLDEKLARVRENEIIEDAIIDDSDDESSPPDYELPVVPEGYVRMRKLLKLFFACKDRYDLKKLLAKWKQQSLNARMKPTLLSLLHLSLLLIRIMNSLLILIYPPYSLMMRKLATIISLKCFHSH